MIEEIRQAKRVFRRDGASKLASKIWRRAVRNRYIPRKVAEFNGITAKRASFLERKSTFPDAERHNLSLIRRHNSIGDAVIVGGGWGFCPVEIAKRSRGDSEVIVYEASERFTRRTRETASLNGVSSKITVNQAIVGESGDIWGPGENSSVIDPSQIPECEFLHLDCDGAEQVILDGLTQKPKTVIVEIHGMFGVEDQDIDRIMKSRGYVVENNITFDAESGGSIREYIQK